MDLENHFFRFAPFHPVIMAVGLSISVLQHHFFTPRRALVINLQALRDIYRLAGTPQQVLDTIPRDPRVFLNYFRLEPELQEYVCCPQCRSIFLNKGREFTAQTCTFQPTQDSPVCGEPLWKEVPASSSSSP